LEAHWIGTSMTKRMTRQQMLNFLEWGAKVLALPYEAQVVLYGDGEGITEGLLDHWDDGVLYLGLAGGATPGQLLAVDRIEERLDAIDDSESPFWLNQQLRESLGWEEIRSMAKDVLAAFGWSEGVPERSLRMETIFVV
jgi:hypothetical protein